MRKKKEKIPLCASTADKYVLYQLSVQQPEFEIEFATKVFSARRMRKPLTLREDFCGTALLCAAWVKSDPARCATGVDLDPKVLAWGTAHNLALLGAMQSRVKLECRNVLVPDPNRYDVIAALNFSYFVLSSRVEMRRYFETARASLNQDGMLILDTYGGWEAQEPVKEPREVESDTHETFTYEWDQHSINPIDSSVVNFIHFRFRDGSALERAFTYRWRLWQLVELQELLTEAGFASSAVYWEDEDEDGEGTGVFRPRKTVSNDPGWLAYIVASV